MAHARENIRVNGLSPGPLRTELLMSFLDTVTGTEFLVDGGLTAAYVTPE